MEMINCNLHNIILLEMMIAIVSIDILRHS